MNLRNMWFINQAIITANNDDLTIDCSTSYKFHLLQALVVLRPPAWLQEKCTAAVLVTLKQVQVVLRVTTEVSGSEYY